MNHLDDEANGVMVNTTPLFASSLLALFYVLRESYFERRLANKPVEQPAPAMEE